MFTFLEKLFALAEEAFTFAEKANPSREKVFTPFGEVFTFSRKAFTFSEKVFTFLEKVLKKPEDGHSSTRHLFAVRRCFQAHYIDSAPRPLASPAARIASSFPGASRSRFTVRLSS